MTANNFGKNHFAVCSVPKYDWAKIAKEKEENQKPVRVPQYERGDLS
jgi:hypothetical protein